MGCEKCKAVFMQVTGGFLPTPGGERWQKQRFNLDQYRQKKERVAQDLVRPGIYQHFKGGKYLVFFVSMGTEDNEKIVVYTPLYGAYAGKIRHRTLKNFTEEVNRPDFNYQGPRFRYLGSASD